MKKIFAYAIAISFLSSACGPSAAEIEKMDREYREKQKAQKLMVDSVIKSNSAEIEAFIGKLRSVNEKLDRGDTFYVKGGALHPPLKYDYSASNLLVIPYQTLHDSMMEYSNENFGFDYGNDCRQILEFYLKSKAKVLESEYYPFYSAERSEVLEKAAKCDVDNYPYALVLVQDTAADVQLLEHSFIGGDLVGYCWLVDLRNMEVIGKRGFYASASDVMVSNKESDYQKKDKIKESSKSAARKIINSWLYSFTSKN